jgi:cyclopropane-fatty-acyl-phospholipid synthase
VAGDRDRWPAEAPAPMLDSWHLAYATGWWAPDGATIGTLEQAQTAMLDRACRMLGLGSDAWLLDLGCGRGALSVYAAHEYGARVTALEGSPPQASLARDRAARWALADRVQVMPRGALGRENFAANHGPYDAVAGLDLGEHVPAADYAAHARAVHRLLVPGGRALLWTVARPSGRGAPPGGPPVESYLTPEVQPRPISETLAALERAGLEIRAVHAMRDHHIRTLAAWRERLERRWTEIVSHVGESTARAWRLHLTGAQLTFEEPRAAMYHVVAGRP